VKIRVAFLIFPLVAGLAFAQGGGSITGTVTDGSGALIPQAKVTLTNPANGTRFEAATTETGNYTLPQVPVGLYTLTVEHDGFKKYNEPNVEVQLTITTRVNAVMTVGAITDSINVTAESTLLRTENAEQSMTISGQSIAELPINFGLGAGAIRNPFSFSQLTPGTSFNGWQNININGSSLVFKIMFEGQEMDSAYQNQVTDEMQPPVEAIQEFTLQTSNFSPEFGLIGQGGMYNYTSKSGSNAYHGSGYEYFANTFLNAGIPFSPTPGSATANIPADRAKTVRHQDDFGGSFGGPVFIPHVYHGKNKTFFFFQIERFRDRENQYVGVISVPNAEYRAGNLSNNFLVTTPANRNLGTDFAGRPIIQNTVYDPASTVIDSSGRRVLTPFPGNIIPTARFDPSAVKLMAFIPLPNIAGDSYVNNYSRSSDYFKLQTLPSIKVDQNIGEKVKIFGYWQKVNTNKSNAPDGMPVPLTQIRDQYIRANAGRAGLDYTISPTLLFHLGIGFERHRNPDQDLSSVANFNLASQLGIIGAPGLGFPQIGNIGDSTLGGLSVSVGVNKVTLLIDQKPVATPTITWVHGNHTFKLGADWKMDTFSDRDITAQTPTIGFSANETSQPLYGQTLPTGTGTGSTWGSFLLGQYDSLSAGNGSNTGYRRTSWALFIQDTFKVTRKLTLDYGIRWDWQQVLREEHDRMQGFDPTLANPNANGLMGASIYAGYGTGRCNCLFAPSYPYAIAPRIGLAYQITPKTVIRAGWGLSFGQLPATGSYPGTQDTGTGNSLSLPSPGNGVAAGILSQPLNLNQSLLYSASYDPSYNVFPGSTVQGAPYLVDPNGGRPPRVNQWNISLQREVVKDLVLEVAFIGNHSVWLSEGGGLINYNAVSPATLAAHGLGDLTNSATTTLLNSSITSAVAVAAGFTKPYANFPNTGTVLQSLKPFPQFSGVPELWAPLGDAWYDAVQGKLTKRFSHGLVATASYAFSKTEDSTTMAGSIYNRASFKGLSNNGLPNMLSFSVDYTIPTIGVLRSNKILNTIFGNWRLGTIQTYQSGGLLSTPSSSTNYASYSSVGYNRMERLPGVPLYNKSLECGCIDPTKDVLLNPAAWVNQTTGQASNVVYYNDFRGMRRPVVSGNFGKSFRIKERVSFNIRGEFFNLFNQNLAIGDPSTRSPQNPPTYSNGLLTGGFGTMAYTNISSTSTGAPRTGQIVARFDF
jgi:hypothetical protein